MKIDEKKINKRISQLQNAILNAVATFERQERKDQSPGLSLLVDTSTVNWNVFNRLSKLCKAYRD